GDQLVGVTFECDEPASARRDKTVVVGGRDTSQMSPGEIDAYVRAELAAGRDLYTLHADALAALDPELILTQDLCRVCALPAGRDSSGRPLGPDHLGGDRGGPAGGGRGGALRVPPRWRRRAG